jgi:hypothetical protein
MSQAARPLQSQDFLRFAHARPVCRHQSLFAKSEQANATVQYMRNTTAKFKLGLRSGNVIMRFANVITHSGIVIARFGNARSAITFNRNA